MQTKREKMRTLHRLQRLVLIRQRHRRLIQDSQQQPVESEVPAEVETETDFDYDFELDLS
jgi:hypothetical protein